MKVPASLPAADGAAASAPAPESAGGAAETAGNESYFVIPLSVQPDGENYLVGNAELEDYYQIPAQGLAILRRLQHGDSTAAIKAGLAADSGDEADLVDVDDFVAMLREIGFVYPAAESGLHAARLASEPADRRILFKVDRRIARAIFSPFTLLCYLGVVGYAAFLAATDPALRLNPHAFFFEHNLAATLVLLLLLSSAAVMLHELGHMLAAARHGISSRLGIGNRLWNLVAEADLSGVLALPKRQRYLPLLAGMMVDLLVIALVILILAALRDTATSGEGFTVPLLQALILQIVVTMTWQFNFFLKTDLYYVLSNYWSYPDLDADARIYLRDRLHRLSNGRYGEAALSRDFSNLRVLKAFSILWVAGRIAALGVLLLVVFPTLYLYAAKTYRAYRDSTVSSATVFDLGLFTLLSLILLGGGLYMWLRGRWSARRTVRKGNSMTTDSNPIHGSAAAAGIAGSNDGAERRSPDSSERRDPARVIALDADFERRGVWAGVEDLAEQAYLDLSAKGLRSVLDSHNYELHLALPKHRDGMPLAYASLTDTSTGVEKTRNFPLDRAYRIVHGLVGLVLEWRDSCPERGGWTILVGNFERSQHLGRRFFLELARRGESRGIRVLADSGSQTALDLHSSEPAALRAEDRAALDRLKAGEGDGSDGAGRPVEALGLDTMEEQFPELLAHHRRTGAELPAALIALKACCLYNHYGYYHESGSFVDTVLPHFEALVTDEDARWNYIGNIFQGLVMIGRLDEALRIIQTLAEPHLTRPDLRAKMSYLLSMIYLRYASTPDLGLAEKHILEAEAYIDSAEGAIDPDDFHFMKVFIDNGLAFLRVRQGRKAEALELCQSGYDRLTTALGEERHRLHRSVLQYNTAQVYVALDQPEAALDHYAKSIEMDPHYSEYYNETANILQRQERYEEALAAYALAIRYSAPYPEVYFNKAVCQTQLGRWDEALASFEFSLELEPRQPEAHLLRAEVYGILGRDPEALADLDAVIAADENSVTARVNRAVLHFNDSRFDLALADMDRVLSLEPGEPEHYENRAEIHKAMGRPDLYADDLRSARALQMAA